jgi:hypothetical protein
MAALLTGSPRLAPRPGAVAGFYSTLDGIRPLRCDSAPHQEQRASHIRDRQSDRRLGSWTCEEPSRGRGGWWEERASRALRTVIGGSLSESQGPGGARRSSDGAPDC